ncbi:hypothetical protein CLFE_028990 [Clostridium felsineum DSM 794]|nr:hypothetical protein CLFE_028990 [Clostridium felsineum DSM 794]
MLNKLEELLEVRSLIAIAMTVVVLVLAFLGRLDGEFLKTIVTMVITYYFANKATLDQSKSNGQ